jgi:hypothetical protein
MQHIILIHAQQWINPNAKDTEYKHERTCGVKLEQMVNTESFKEHALIVTVRVLFL